MRILVTNPTGNIGRKILSELLAPEFSVLVLAGDPSRLPGDIRDQVEVIRGSADDSVTLRRALEGVEALFWCVPAPMHEANVRTYYERFSMAGSRAIRQAGTERVVTISAAGNVLSRSAGAISGLRSMENILNQSGAAIRHLRCGWFMENFLRQKHRIWGSGVLSYPLAGHIAVPIIAAKDVADIALRWLVRRDWNGARHVPVYGPEDLSFNKAASILQQVLDIPVRYAEVSDDDFVRRMVRAGASVHYARNVAAMFAALAQGIPRIETETNESTTSTTLTEWTRSELLPLLKAPFPGPEPDRVAADINHPQPTISAFSCEGFLRCFGAGRTRANACQLYSRGRPRSRTQRIAHLYTNAFAERWAGEGI
jgi:uncharacterized protein YbjT (DUF2867 family)